jgi:branched-chain amino acid transport system substrate-binding protein
VRAVAVVAALPLVLGACAAQQGSGGGGGGGSKVDIPAVTTLPIPPGAANAAGDGKAKCSNATIAYAGAETGPNAQLGINIRNGVQLAVDQHNKANKNCQVTLKKFDTEGDPGKAPGIVTQVVSEKDIIGVLGLPFSGESKATGQIFEQGKLAHITASATNPDLTKNGWTTFFRALGNDATQGPAVVKFLNEKLKAKKVCVIQDDSDYGIGLAKTANAALGDKAKGCQDKVTTGQKDFSATVNKVMSAKPDVVFYSGYYAEAAPLDQQLVTKGYKGTFLGPDGVKDPQFIKQAGSASSNALFTCPCVPGELVKSFADGYKSVSGGQAPGTYSLEGYDSATILLKGIDSGATTRAKLLDYVKNYNGPGLSKVFKWDNTGELSQTHVYAYKVQSGQIVYAGQIS